MKKPNLRVTLLAGGVGGAKMAEGFAGLRNIDLSIIGNVADDDDFHGLTVSPDIDTLTYTLSGIVNREQGWGIKDEGFRALSILKKLGNETWMTLGDADFGLHIYRNQRLSKGDKPSTIAKDIARKLGVKAELILPTNDRVRTQVQTNEGWISFQEYFVKKRCKPRIFKLRYDGIKKAKINNEAANTIKKADMVVIAPSNPLVSIMPIIDIPGFQKILAEKKSKVVCVSPIISGKAVKGPANRMLIDLGYKSNAFDALSFYKKICTFFVIDHADKNLGIDFINSNLTHHLENILMNSTQEKQSLAKKIIKILFPERKI
jgi:LPPG:FO 2-phospho-L-lactate transferase